MVAASLGLLLLLFTLSHSSIANPSAKFFRERDEVYDEWGICRTRAYGEDGFFEVSRTGFRPVIAYESLGKRAERAYELGAQMAKKYGDERRLARAIFDLVRDSIRYESDLKQFGYEDYAQNADELIKAVDARSLPHGDCEDYAILLAVMWKGAGLRSAIVLAPKHAAALVRLPGYPGVNMFWNLNGEKGWIWGEATGSSNPLGWTPDQFLGEDLVAYEIGDVPQDIGNVRTAPGASVPLTPRGTSPFLGISPFFSIIFFMWIISTAARGLRRLG